jgi:hypothetical protein
MEKEDRRVRRIYDLNESTHFQDDSVPPRKYPPQASFRNRQDIGTEDPHPQSGSSSATFNPSWRLCAVQCLVAWLVYLCRGIRPADRERFEREIPLRTIEIIVDLLDNRITHDRALALLLPLIYHEESTMGNQGILFMNPVIFSSAYFWLFTPSERARYGENEGLLISLTIESTYSCLVCQTTTSQSSSNRPGMAYMAPYLTSDTLTSEHFHLNDSFCVAGPHQKCRTCLPPSTRMIQSVQVTHHPYLLALDVKIEESSVGGGVIEGGDGLRMANGIYDLTAVCYIGKDDGNTTSHFVILMRSNEEENLILSYNSRSSGGVFEHLRQRSFPLLYLSLGVRYYTSTLIFKYRREVVI